MSNIKDNKSISQAVNYNLFCTLTLINILFNDSEILDSNLDVHTMVYCPHIQPPHKFSAKPCTSSNARDQASTFRALLTPNIQVPTKTSYSYLLETSSIVCLQNINLRGNFYKNIECKISLLGLEDSEISAFS